jgi:hypothetical protein
MHPAKSLTEHNREIAAINAQLRADGETIAHTGLELRATAPQAFRATFTGKRITVLGEQREVTDEQFRALERAAVKNRQTLQELIDSTITECDEEGARKTLLRIMKRCGHA